MGKNITRKLIAVLVIFTMVFATSAIAFAADSPGGGDEPTPAKAATITSFKTVATVGGTNKVVSSWTAKNAKSYQFSYRKAGGSWTKKATSKKSYTVSGMANGSLYQFKVRGKNADGKYGAWSKTITRYLAQAKNIKVVSKKKKQMTITASKVSGATGFQIKYSTSKNMTNVKSITVKTTKALNKTIKNLKSGKTYYVQVRPVKKYNGTTYTGAIMATYKVKVK